MVNLTVPKAICLAVAVLGIAMEVVSSTLDIPYTCGVDGTVHIDLTKTSYTHVEAHNHEAISALGITTATSSGCQYNLAPLPSNKTVSLTKCDWKTSVFLYLMKNKADKIIGGSAFHEYKLDCKLKSNGTLVSVSKTFNVNQKVTPTTESVQPNITLVMTIDPASAYLGQELTLTITESTSTVHHKLEPQKCTASHDNNVDPVIVYELGTSTDEDIMSASFNTTVDNTAFATMYAFKFKSSATVTVTCEVKVCPSSGCDVHKITTVATSPTPTPHSRRRRRSAGNNKLSDNVHSVEGSFKIISTRETSSAAKFTVVWWSTAMMTAVTMMQNHL